MGEDTIGDKVARFLSRARANRPNYNVDMTAAKQDASLQEGPLVMKPAEQGVGHRLAPLTLADLKGQKLSLEAGKGQKALLLAYFSADCPLSAKFAPELARLEKDCAAGQVRMILVDPIKEESAETIQAFLSKNGLSSTVVQDRDGQLAAALHPKTTTETFLLDASNTIAYRGAINDQYGLGYQLDAPRHPYLREALSAVIKGETPQVTATSAPVCAGPHDSPTPHPRRSPTTIKSPAS